MSAEDRLAKLTEEQLLHLNSLKDKLEKIDGLTSKCHTDINLLEDQVYADPIRKLQEEIYGQLIALREGLHQTIDLSCAASLNPSSESSFVVPTIS